MKALRDKSRWPEVQFALIILHVIIKRASHPIILRRKGTIAVGCRCKQCHQISHNSRTYPALEKASTRLTKKRMVLRTILHNFN